jgi:hypothetical protein
VLNPALQQCGIGSALMLSQHQHLEDLMQQLLDTPASDPSFDLLLHQYMTVSSSNQSKTHPADHSRLTPNWVVHPCAHPGCVASALAGNDNMCMFLLLLAPVQDTEAHLQEEEEVLLPALAKQLSPQQLMDLGRQFEWAKLIAPSR